MKSQLKFYFVFTIQYFLINEGIYVTSDIFFSFYYFLMLSCLFNDSGLKCVIWSTDMHKIGDTFLFLDCFLLQSILEEGGGGDVLH